MNRLRDNRGITLVELLIAMGLVAIILTVAFSAMSMGIKSYNLSLTQNASQQGLREAALHITRQVHNAPAGSVSASGASLTVDGVQYIVSGNKLLAGGTAVATNIQSLGVSVNGKVLTVTLTATDGQSLNTKLYLK